MNLNLHKEMCHKKSRLCVYKVYQRPTPSAASSSCQKPSRAPLPAFFIWHCIPSSANPQYTFPAFLLTVLFQTAYNSVRIYTLNSLQPISFVQTLSSLTLHFSFYPFSKTNFKGPFSPQNPALFSRLSGISPSSDSVQYYAYNP